MYNFRKYFSKNSDSYVVLNNFENATEKQCIRMDKKNERIYSSLLARAERATKAIGDTILSINIEVPCPPRPSNRDRLIIWKKRNVSKPVIAQTDAVLFLVSRGFEIDKDYEAYQAIDLAKELKLQEGIKESVDDKSKQFDNIYTKNDSNILRRRSFLRSLPEAPEVAPKSPKHTNHTHAQVRFSFQDNKNMIINEIQEEAPDFTPQKPSAPPMSHNILYPPLHQYKV
jgi:hypothetical protein